MNRLLRDQNFRDYHNDQIKKRRDEFQVTPDVLNKVQKHAEEKAKKKREMQLKADKENAQRIQKRNHQIQKRKEAENQLKDVANLISVEDKRDLAAQFEIKYRNTEMN